MKKPIKCTLLALLLTYIATGTCLANKKTPKKSSQNRDRDAKLTKTRTEQTFGELKQHSVGVGIGQTFLAGNLKDHGENQITIDLYYTYKASYSFDFMANAHFSEHDYKGQETSIKGITGSIKAKLYQFDSFAPFLFGGLGFYVPVIKRPINGELVESKTKVTFGTNFGGGIDLMLNEHFIFGALLHYHNPFDVEQEVGNEVEGSYLKMLLTTMYTF